MTTSDDRFKDDIIVLLMPESYLQLRLEIEKHPELVQIFKDGQGANTPTDEVLAHTAAFCGIVLNGYYTEQDMIKLGDVLREALIKKRTEILWLPAGVSSSEKTVQ